MKKIDNLRVGEDAEELGLSHIAGRDMKWCNHFVKLVKLT